MFCFELITSFLVKSFKIKKRNFFVQIVTILFIFSAVTLFCIIFAFYTNKTCQKSSLNQTIFERLKGPFKADDDEVLRVLRSEYLREPSSKNYNLSKNHLYNLSKHKYSWPFIYRFTKSLFGKETGKFFVEAGALDGEFLSNTLWLEKDLNWTGLLIEPDPYNYNELLAKNRKSWTSRTCMSSTSFPKRIVLVSRRRGKEKSFSNGWVFRGSSHEYGYLVNDSSVEKFFRLSTLTYVSVQCFPLESYLLALNRTVIDFLSLDVQGSEMDILMQFPFHRFTIRAMAIEHDTPFYDENFVNFFTEKGFKVIGCGGEPDYFFINKSHFQHLHIKEKFECPMLQEV